MFTPKHYLRLEWANVSRTLQETLRYRYSKKKETEAFYQECSTRLDDLRDLLDRVSEADEPALFEIWRQLAKLSRLITNIERSHLEEFSWPFAAALKAIAERAFTNVLFLFKAEGGLCSYALHPESPGVGRKRIYPVVFPRGIRDFVLLHAIIGHEFGHAALVSHRGALQSAVGLLVRDSIVTKPNDLFDWCQTYLRVGQRIDDRYLQTQATGWAKEFFCDLFGLVIMGPAFLPAFVALLETPSFSTDATPYVPSHPPFAPRAIALLHGARALKLLYSEETPSSDLNELSVHLDRAFVNIASKWQTGPFSILSETRIHEAAAVLVSFVSNFSPLVFPRPDAEVMSGLLRAIRADVPPVGRFTARRATEDNITVPEPETVDFRHILLAGWLEWSEPSHFGDEQRFQHINGLCSHAIMQQEGIEYWKKRHAELAAVAP
jgi:hypothetical protein